MEPPLRLRAGDADEAPHRVAFVRVPGEDHRLLPPQAQRRLTGGSAARWGFAMYLATKDGYQDAVLPTGDFASPPEDALDCAAGLYLGDPNP